MRTPCVLFLLLACSFDASTTIVEGGDESCSSECGSSTSPEPTTGNAEPGSTSTGGEDSGSDGGGGTGGGSGDAEPFCGDYHQDPGEECDSFAGCHNCRRDRWVFVTSALFGGSYVDGLQGADARCQYMADNAELEGAFRAWLSDSVTDAQDRLPAWKMGVYRAPVTKEAVLIDGVFIQGIYINESGIPTEGDAWTGTAPDGTKLEENCEDWTAAGETIVGYFGTIGAVDGNWTQSDDPMNPYGCGVAKHLYCFEI